MTSGRSLSPAAAILGDWLPASNLTSWLMAATVLLLAAELLIGTALYFAVAVFLTLILVILTLRRIGYASLGGILIGYFAFRYLVLSQIAKVAYGQPGESNLAAPETTIAVLMVGIASICAAALVVAAVIKDRKVISFAPSIETLAYMRNLTFLIGVFAQLATTSYGYSESGEAEYGGIVGIAKQFSAMSYFAVVAETWRVLTLTDGRRSTSRPLLFIVGVLVAVGFAFNSKTGIAQPCVAYLITSIAYRRAISRRQIFGTLVGAVLFVGVIYPMVHILRALSDHAGIVLELNAVLDLALQGLSDPSFFQEQWALVKATPDDTIYAQGLYYLGSADDLLGRFLLIANTDTIVNAVNRDGIYGPALITAGFDTSLPQFIRPEKLQYSTGDIVTWYYGLRSWGYVGYPANGLLADCYAALGWTGVVIIPFFLQLLLLAELQLVGRNIAGNPVGIFLLLLNFHTFGEANIQQYITNILRGIPQYLIVVVLLFYAADILLRRRMRHGPPTSIG